jgi:uncharacterized damage-inducible protein DinB
MTNDAIIDPVRHNAWSTLELIDFVIKQRLSPEQLASKGVGTFGDIVGTLDHIVRCDASYLRRLADLELPWVDDDSDLDLLGLRARAGEARQGWEDFLAKPYDPDRVIIIDDGTEGVHAGIILAQAINHANHHREQVCAILTGLGIEPPDLQAWAYAWRTGRIWKTEPRL